MFKRILTMLVFWAASSSMMANAAVTWNVNDDKTNPVVGNAKAPKGGSMVWGSLSYPKSLNYMVSGDVASVMIWELVVETLCEVNDHSGELVPLVAEKWSISEDKKTFTFHINPKAKFTDGTQVTARDVKAYWDVIQNPKNLVGGLRAGFDKIKSVEMMGEKTIKVTAKDVHFANLSTACALSALDHDFYLAEGKDFNKAFNNKIKGSGPYTVAKVKKGKEVHLKRNKNYWGADLPQNKGRYNFDKLVYRTIDDLSIRYELFKKGEIDGFEFNVAKRWKTETNGDRFQKNWVIARRVNNLVPKGFSGNILNTRRELFKDKTVRKALAHSYNRGRFIKELFYDNYSELKSYFPNSIYANPNLKTTEFDLKKARALLAEAGWTKVNNKGILEKDGKAFSFNYLYTGKSAERYLTIWKNDLKKIGIEMKLELTTWPTMVKKWEKYNFDVAGVAWSGSLEPDPFTLWHSKFKDETSGNNLPGFSSPELDKLITDIRPIYDANARAKVFHKIDSILFENHPYILGWFLDHIRVGYWNKFGFIESGAPKYTRGDRIYHYAWYDADKAKALEKAMKDGKALPTDKTLLGPN